MMIRKVTLNISFANIGKLFCLELILEEAKRVINLYIDRLWEAKNFSDKFVDFKVKTWLSARMQQCLGKQALEIVKSLPAAGRSKKAEEEDQAGVSERYVESGFEIRAVS